MCGIVGVAGRAGAIDEALLVRMRDTLCHRGPDAQGLWRAADGSVALGHRRLSVIDLSVAAGQPMSDASGRLHIIYNGELYNYRELGRELQSRGHGRRTASDTEVVLEAYRAWGTECLARFVGMFAFALWDEDARRLFVARDRVGEKPLFYRQAGGALHFASELKALLVHPEAPRTLDREALEYYLACGFVPGDRCMLSGFRKLAPAHALTYEPDRDALVTWRYWELPPAQPDGASAEALAEELEGLLEQSVRGQLIADVPVGILLSGGLDSSLVTAFAARVSSHPVHTFTVTFPGHGRFDEAPHARLVASHFGTRHSEVVAAPATVDLLPRLAAQYDEPLADSSMVPTYLVSRAIRASATVALGGDGGDELFGGYQPYRWILQQESVRRFVPAFLQRVGRAAVERWAPPGTRGRSYLLGYTTALSDRIAHLRVFFDPAGRARLLRDHGDAAPERFLGTLVDPGATPVQRLTRTDFLTYLPDDILVKVDRAAMLASLEVRAPLLDHRIVEFAFRRVPDRLKVTTTTRKLLLRQLAKRLLPGEFDTARKQGFSVPLATWFRGSWGNLFSDVLSQAPHDLFDPAEIRRLLDAQRHGRAHMHRLFALTMLELWRREYGVAT